MGWSLRLSFAIEPLVEDYRQREVRWLAAAVLSQECGRFGTDVIDNLYSSHEELLRLQNEVTVYDSQSSSEGDSDDSAINVSTIH